MLRLLVLVLALANIVFFAWTRGSLDGLVSWRAQGDREPERMSRQVRPEDLQLLGAAAASAALQAGTEAASPVVCLEAGPYTATQITPAESALQAVMPPGSWANVKGERSGVWLVYMGKFPNREAVQKKIEEVKRLRLPFEEIRAPAELEDGLSLGRYDSRAAAEKALGDLTTRGVRTARVVVLSPPVPFFTLRVERADAAVQSRLASLRPEALQGKSFGVCVPRP